MAVDALGIGLHQHVATVRTDHIAVHAVERSAFHIVHIQEHAHLFARLKRAHLNALGAFAHAGIGFSVGQWSYTTYRRSCKLAASQVFYLQFLSGCCPYCQQQSQCYQKCLFHHSYR